MAVVGVDIRNRAPFEAGEAFGEAGPYERLDLLFHVAVDPDHPANVFVADLDRAQRRGDGRVWMEVDGCLLQPVDPAKGNGCLLTSVVNRGRMDLVPFSFPPPTMTFAVTERIEPGDGLLLRQGWSVLFCGWQWDVLRRPGRLGVQIPRAMGVEADVTTLFQPNRDRSAEYLGHWPWHPRPGHPDITHAAYPTAGLDDTRAVLTERDRMDGEPRMMPRERWRFARASDDGQLHPDPRWIWSVDGFRAGVVYELKYRSTDCPVVGLGLVALRDVPSFLRSGTPQAGNPAAGRINHTVAWGVSQTGRTLRQFLMDGANVDETGQRVHDGVFVQVAGARRGEFNHRGAQPSVQNVVGAGHQPPFRHEPGLLDRLRAAGGVPKLFEVNTANEYWRSEAALLHLDPEELADVAPPPDVRLYALAGTQHTPGMVALSREPILLPEARSANWINQVNQTSLLRALLVDLRQWVVDDVQPPTSRVPTLAEGTAVPRTSVLRELPGLVLPDVDRLPTIDRPVWVSAVDDDGNEVAGIRPPELAVPLATHLGWNVRHPDTGGAGQLLDMLGSSLPFAAQREERASSGDPRPSVAERYADRDDYTSQVRNAAGDLVAERFLLEEDVERVVRTAGRLYDLVTGADRIPEATRG
jgi:hypothetical protein